MQDSQFPMVEVELLPYIRLLALWGSQERHCGAMVLRRSTCLSVGILCLATALTASASEGSCSFGKAEPSLDSALAFVKGHAVEAEQDLLGLAGIPSISSMEDYHGHVIDAGKWLVRRLRRAGMKVCSHIPCMCSSYTSCMQLMCHSCAAHVPSFSGTAVHSSSLLLHWETSEP